MKILFPNAQVTFDLSTREKRDWLVAELANRLEPITAEFKSLKGRKCLGSIGKLFNMMRTGHPLVKAAGPTLMKHCVIHGMTHAKAPIITWNDYWDRLLWQQFTSMLTTSYPLLLEPDEPLPPAALEAFQRVLESILDGLEVLDLVRVRADQFHWNCNGEEPIPQTEDAMQLELIMEAREGTKRRAIEYSEHLKSL